MSDIREIAQQVHDGGNDGRTGRKPRKPEHSYGWYTKLPHVNEQLECIAVLKQLNDAITMMYQLSDTRYYLDYIWNAGTTLETQLEEHGYTSDYFVKIAERLELLRSLLFGDSADWDGLYQWLYDDLLGHEVYWNHFHEEQAKRMERELKALKEKVKDE